MSNSKKEIVEARPDLGFGAALNKRQNRMLNTDGSINVRKTGAVFSIYEYLIRIFIGNKI